MKEEVVKLEEAAREVVRLLQQRVRFTAQEEAVIARWTGSLCTNLGWWRKDMKKLKPN